MVATRSDARRRGRAGRALLQTPIVDPGHILCPLAGWKVIVLLEAGKPVLRVLLSHDKEGPSLLSDGQPAFDLWIVRLHR